MAENLEESQKHLRVQPKRIFLNNRIVVDFSSGAESGKKKATMSEANPNNKYQNNNNNKKQQ